MAVIPISHAVAVMLGERGLRLDREPDRAIPDDWLALLEQMNGSGGPAALDQSWREPVPAQA